MAAGITVVAVITIIIGIGIDDGNGFGRVDMQGVASSIDGPGHSPIKPA